MSSLTTRVRLIGLGLLLTTAAAGTVIPASSFADAPGVDALVKQAQYWRSKGRDDLAEQALRRAKMLDPKSSAVANALNAPSPKPQPQPKPKPRPAPAPAPARAVKTSVPETRAPQRATSSSPALTSANRGGQARVAGFNALDNGNLSSAATQFQRAVSVNRNDADALGGLGLVRLREGRFDEAANLLTQASRLGRADQWATGLASARFFAGIGATRALLEQGQLAEAQAQAEGLVRSGYAEPAPALELLGQIYEKQGRYGDAADLYRQASEGAGADGRRLQMRAARGRALAAAGRGDDLGAMTEFQQGLLLDPADPWIRYEFAQFMIKRGRLPEAESLLRSLESRGGADSLYAAALISADLDRPSDADRLISMIPEQQRTDPMRRFAAGLKTDTAIARAKAMAKTGQQAGALAALHQIGAMASIPSGKRAAIANAMFELGDTAGAADLAERTLYGQVTNLEDYEGLIGVLSRTGRDDLAAQALQSARQLAEASPEGQQAYARMSAVLMVSQADRARLAGRFAESFDILQTSYNAAPDNAEILSALARLYQSGAMPARAAQTYQLMLTRKPGDKTALLGLAETAQAAGDRNLSEQAQTQVLRAFPQDYEVRLALAQVERARGNERAAVRLLTEARDLYARQHGGNALIGSGGNPFAGMGPNSNANPFRNQTVTAAPPINPFALSDSSRLPSKTVSYSPASYPIAAPAYGSAAVQNDFTQSYDGDAPAAAPIYSADPVMNDIQSQIAELAQDSGPRVDVNSSFLQRSGETGLSELNVIKGSAKLSTGAMGGRVYAGAEAVVADAGRPSDSARARFGRNASPEARAIVAEVNARNCDALSDPAMCLADVDSQHAAGVAFSVGYENDYVQLEAGTTPIGMGKTKATFRAAVNPKLSESIRASALAERKPVTDSIVSYAGTLDPVTGQRWGQVMRTAGGLGLSYDREGNGAYLQGRYYSFNGTNVVKNEGFEANVGGYMRAYRDEKSALTVGLNVNYQAYDKSQNSFTFGNGGYFSPQSFISVGFPVNYTMEDARFDVRGSFTPGFQSYSQDRSAIYPTDLVAQAELDNLKALSTDVRSFYDGVSKTGFAVSAEGSLYYKVTPTTRIGGEASYNTFGNYNELRGTLGVRQSLGSNK